MRVRSNVTDYILHMAKAQAGRQAGRRLSSLNKKRVWKHFDDYQDEVNVEPERTTNKKIRDLLAPKTKEVQGVLTQIPGASKTGHGTGRPDFIIQFKTKAGGLRDDLIIIVECKASDHNKATDEAQHYSAYLSKEYDVLSIATSGEEEDDFEVSHFLQLKGRTVSKKVFGDELLPPEDYLEEYLSESAAQYREDYDSLLTFSGEFSETLHSHKILAPQRALLLGCILIALEDASFADPKKDAGDSDHGYKKKADGQALATALVGAAMDQLRQGLRDPQYAAKLKVLEDHFAFIESNLALTTERDKGTKKPVLEGVIESVHTKVHGFNKNHEYIDTLGQLYIEFLRYANADSSLGIVLTPPHIAKFMAEVAGVSKDSFVYDSCTGTAGFLIAAMGLMVQDAAGKKAKIEDIKQKQLIGIEYQAHMLALAASNMFIHEDGKTNIIQGDCFDEEKQRLVKWRTQGKGNEGEPPADWAETVKDDEQHELGADVGLLNPPYKVQKNDREELEFIEAAYASCSPSRLPPGGCARSVRHRLALRPWQAASGLEADKGMAQADAACWSQPRPPRNRLGQGGGDSERGGRSRSRRGCPHADGRHNPADPT